MLGPASDKTWWNGNPNDNETVSHCRWLTYSSVTLHIQYFQRQNLFRLDNCGTEEEMTTSKSHLRTRRFSSIPCWQAICCVFAVAFSSGMITSESREADSQSFRTVRICQNDRRITVLYHEKGNGIDALTPSIDQPRLKCCEGQNGTIIYIRALQDHSQGVAINPDQFSFKQKPLHWKEHRLHTGNSSSYKSILENGQWAGRLRLRITRQACFFPALNPQESSTRQRTIDWTR